MSTVPKSRYLLFFALAIIGTALDLWSKACIFNRHPPLSVDWIWQDYLGIQTTFNSGALFGLGEGGSFWFAALSIFAAIGIIYWLFVAGAAKDLLLTISLGAMMGGNLYDRVGLWHTAETPQTEKYCVRDWIHVTHPTIKIPYIIPWPNFNIADSLLVCGAIILMWHAFRQPAEPDQNKVVKKKTTKT